MPISRLTAILFVASCAALWSATASANEAAFSALEQAIIECEARAELLGDARFSFHRIVEKENGARLQAFFTPQGTSEGSWELVDPPLSDAPRKVRRAFKEFAEEDDSDRLISLREPRRYLHSEFQLADETADSWIFRGPTIDLSDDTERTRNFMRKARDALVAEVVVRKNPVRLASLQLTNTKPIYPVPVAVIEDFYLKYDFDEAWPGGPIIMRAVRQSVAGKAFFAKFHMILNVDNFEMLVSQ